MSTIVYAWLSGRSTQFEKCTQACLVSDCSMLATCTAGHTCAQMSARHAELTLYSSGKLQPMLQASRAVRWQVGAPFKHTLPCEHACQHLESRRNSMTTNQLDNISSTEGAGGGGEKTAIFRAVRWQVRAPFKHTLHCEHVHWDLKSRGNSKAANNISSQGDEATQQTTSQVKGRKQHSKPHLKSRGGSNTANNISSQGEQATQHTC